MKIDLANRLTKQNVIKLKNKHKQYVRHKTYRRMSDNKIVLLKKYVKANSPKFATTCKKYQ